MNFVCPYFSPEGMVMLTSGVRGHFVTYINGLHSQESKNLFKDRIRFPEDCFGSLIWPPGRRVKTIH